MQPRSISLLANVVADKTSPILDETFAAVGLIQPHELNCNKFGFPLFVCGHIYFMIFFGLYLIDDLVPYDRYMTAYL